ncbi:Hypothetical predicted protein [Pelobates cultripes]|uniref:Uncharacterized protein n=1 Tax=Pelobates cultripes TaxID=61616 RepID=A0AAD1R2R6_PELCU|nr:Hypothetical predicted protein [Pelobates cultripes]
MSSSPVYELFGHRAAPVTWLSQTAQAGLTPSHLVTSPGSHRSHSVLRQLRDLKGKSALSTASQGPVHPRTFLDAVNPERQQGFLKKEL